jgi:hypothetical protein
VELDSFIANAETAMVLHGQNSSVNVASGAVLRDLSSVVFFVAGEASGSRFDISDSNISGSNLVFLVPSVTIGSLHLTNVTIENVAGSALDL